MIARQLISDAAQSILASFLHLTSFILIHLRPVWLAGRHHY